ncbi:hypothetical protein ACT1U9_32985 (plasmid) [Streptomyces sp. BR1]|uniref:hypothetical protein n=1 Tax=Streptomyces sp. BR1 TaxID=1592323 RepID=UPI00402B5755
MFKTSTKRRHLQLMRLARHLIGECQRRRILGRPGPIKAAPDDLIALAFGRQIQLDQDEALRYLDSARVEKGLNRELVLYPADVDDQEQGEVAAEEPAQI